MNEKKKLHVDRVIYNLRILKKKMNNSEDTYNFFSKNEATNFFFNNE